MKKILFLHGSSELYGASKVLLSILASLDRKTIKPIVVLPYRGILYDNIKSLGVSVEIGPIAILRRQNFNPVGSIGLISDLIKSIRFIRKLDKAYSIDMVYSNTSAVLSGAIYTRLFRKKHIWHVHEITVTPALFRWLMPRLINTFSDACIAVSNAVKSYLVSSGIGKTNITVVYNGTDGLRKAASRVDSKPYEGKKVVGMVGRLNRWKGQEVFVGAASKVIESGLDVQFLIAGSCFKNEEIYDDRLKKLISTLKLEGKVRIVGFVDDIAGFYEDIDILVVPSILPEPFGLVAIEAMSCKKPIIASNIGALPEIVVDGKTGVLFEPGDAEQLKNAIIQLIKDDALCLAMGQAGFERQAVCFNGEKFRKGINEVIWTSLEEE
ncbi:MAG: glycosyltransferase family 4 protein [Candidatus Omnitrophota bacterium]|jgi:glycosyltransferase involved in cell wall biosynthesis